MRKLIDLSKKRKAKSLIDPEPSEIAITSLDEKLVENAIKHGMISPDDPFAIDLEIFIREHTLHIRIGNDGTRISLEQMKKLLDFDASRQELLDFDQKSYGVQNIQRRIQILCGISYGLSYEIRNNRTWCDLTLPVLEHDPSEKTGDLQ